MQINFITLTKKYEKEMFLYLKNQWILDYNWNKRKINFTIDRIEYKNFQLILIFPLMDWSN